MDWNNIFSKYQLDTSKIFCKGHIPEKKMANVLGSYAKNIKREDILILVDDTVFGGAKDGLILARQGLFLNKPFEDPLFLAIAGIDKISSEGRNIFVNDTQATRLDIIDKKSFQNLCSLLFEMVSILRSENNLESVQEESQDQSNKSLISDEIKDILRETSFSSNRLFLVPEIPYSKSANVVDSYAMNIDVDEIILLYDDTALGGAKDGFIITNDRIYAHQFLMQPVSIKINEIDFITVSEHDFLINGEKKFTASLLDDHNMKKVKEFIEKLCELKNKDIPQIDKDKRQLQSEICASTAFYFLSLISECAEYKGLMQPNPETTKIINCISSSRKYAIIKILEKYWAAQTIQFRIR